MSCASCCGAVSSSALAPSAIAPSAIKRTESRIAANLHWAFPANSVLNPMLFPVSMSRVPDVLGSHHVLVAVAEMRPHVVHHSGDLAVGHHITERRHAAPSVDDK